MNDLETKRFILENGLHHLYAKIHKNVFKKFSWYSYNVKNSQLEFALEEEQKFIDDYGIDVRRVCINLNHSYYRKRELVRKRIDYMLKIGRVIFLTFTFTDKSLQNTSRDYRREKLCQYLNSYGLYIANIDFGRKFGREHYHAVLLLKDDDEVDYSKWVYGALNGCVVNYRGCDNERIATYITKLSNHCLKDSTKNERVIYSRQWRNIKI